MKLRAIRVAAFRRFSAPVAIEDIRDGVNVLSAPNEAGKSTLFAALEAAFLRSYSSTSKVIDGFKPYGGGDPRIEIDFDADGRSWRYAKQFGRGAFAQLTDLTSGRDVARNADAETQADALIGNAGENQKRFGLVWVRQREGLHLPVPDFDPLDGKPRMRGEALTLRQAVAREIDQSAGGALFDAVSRRTQAALDLLLTPTRRGAKAHGPLDLAQRAARAAEARLNEATAAARASEQRVQAIRELKETLANLEASARDNTQTNDVTQLESTLASVRMARSSLEAARTTAKIHEIAAINSRQRLADLDEKAAELADIERRLAEALPLDAAIRQLSQELNGEPVTRATVEELARLYGDRDVARATLKAASARVSVALAPDHGGRIVIDGKPQSSDVTYDVADSTRIEAAGLARIDIAMPGGATAAETRATELRLTRDIETLEARLHVHSIGAARARLAERDAKAVTLDETRRALMALAPAGVERLKADQQARRSELANAGIDDKRAEHVQNDLRWRDAAAAVTRLESEVPSEDRLRTLDAGIAEARRASKERDSQIVAVRLRLEHLIGEQAGADNDGRAGDVQAANEAVALARADVERLTVEVDALLLLAATLEAAKRRQRDTLTTPMTQRLLPRLDRVMAAQSVALSETFEISALTRDGLDEPLGAVSDGTREQIGVLVRLAIAELLAATGSPVPLILDDPLAFADDARLAAVNGEIAGAAADNDVQVVVLTCRPAAFDTLPGHRLALSSWTVPR